MARIAGVDIPNDKQVQISLTYIHGIGRTKAKEAVNAVNVNPETRVRQLTEDEISRLLSYLVR